MQGQVRYELEDKENDTLLHCFIPKDVPGREVDLSYDVDGISKGTIAIHFDSQTRGKLGCVQLNGYVFPEDIEAKFSKKQSRYTFRLVRAANKKEKTDISSDDEKDVSADQDVESQEHFSDAVSSAPPTPTAAAPAEVADSVQDSKHQMPYPQAAANGNHQPSDSPELAAEAPSPGAKLAVCAAASDVVGCSTEQPQLEQQATSTGADAAEVEREDGDNDDDDDDKQDQQEGAADSEGAVHTTKRRRGHRKKKKKKSKSAAAGSDAAGATAAEAGSESQAATAAAEAPTAEEEEEEFQDAISEGLDDIVPGSSHQPAAANQQQQLLTGDSSPSRPASAVPPIVFDSSNYASHFSEEPVAGTTTLASHPDDPVLLPETLLHGPFVHSCLDKHEVKGEDKGLNLKGCSWTPAGGSVPASFSAFGIFDGHGGKPAATYASKELLPMVMRLVDRCIDGSGSSRHPSAALAGKDGAQAEDEQTWGVEVTDEDRAVWSAQEALVDRLPKAMFAGFLEADKTCRARHRVSGTTATLAVVVGWELIVANVGDSAAFLDTGREVIALSGNHRIEDCPAERERVILAGGEISKSVCDGKPVGPDRVWPGGLAMSRSIGDPQAPQVIAVPEIRHVTLPTTGGRLVIGSDGVWDHMQPKSMIHQVRNQGTDAAAKKIAASALKKKGLRDDISVLVVDLVPTAADPRPPALLQGPVRDAVEPCQVMRPLSEVELEAAIASIENKAAEGSELLQQQLQTAASVTSVTAANNHWKDNAAARRDCALRLVRLAAQREAEAAAAEKARLAELAAKAEMAARGEELSDTYKELAALRLDVSVVVAEVKEQQKQRQAAEQEHQAATVSAADDEASGWTTVGGSSASAGNGFVSFEDQLRATAGSAAAARQQQQRGRGRGRGRGPVDRGEVEHQQGTADGRGGRGSRGRGGGRGRNDSSREGGEQQQHEVHCGDAATDGDAFARGGRGRGRGRLARHFEGQPQQDEQHAPHGHNHQQHREDDSHQVRGRGRGGRIVRGGRAAGFSTHRAEEHSKQTATEQHSHDATGAATDDDQYQQRQHGGFEGRGRGRGGRGGRGGRCTAYRGEEHAAQQHGENQHLQESAATDTAAAGRAAGAEHHAGRSTGARRGRGRGEFRTAYVERRPSGDEAHAAADAAHTGPSADQRQQQYWQPRSNSSQQQHRMPATWNGNAHADAGVQDVSNNASVAAGDQAAVRLVPRPGRVSFVNKGFAGGSNAAQHADAAADIDAGYAGRAMPAYPGGRGGAHRGRGGRSGEFRSEYRGSGGERYRGRGRGRGAEGYVSHQQQEQQEQQA